MILKNLLLDIDPTGSNAPNFSVVAGDADFGVRLMHGLKVAAIGLLVVFLVLVILWAIITIMGKILGKPRKNPEAVKQPASPAVANDLAAASEEETVVAIAVAAIAAYEGKSSVDFDIVSVTPIEFTENK